MTKGDSRGSWVIIITALALAASCAEPTTFTAQAPTVPVLRLPRNDVYQGSVLTGSLRPIFTWEASTAPSAPIRYELQYSTDRSFTAADVVTVNADEPRFQPEANLSVSPTPPVGRRYYWHVRACVMESCSAYSPTWWVNLGRSAKDFNGDGYADVLVGAPAFENRGAASIFFGGPGPTLDTIADALLDDSVTSDNFGRIVEVGDFNGDGFADAAVASFRKTFVYFGGTGRFDESPDVIFPQLASDSAVRDLSAGDVNADGFSDLVIGDSNNSEIRFGAGKVFVYYGGADGGHAVSDGTLDGEAIGQGFGYHADVIDLNGDEFADIVVSSNSFDDDFKPACFADVFFGQAGDSFQSLERLHIRANTTGYCTSQTIGVGDLEGDGFNDIAMGIKNGGGLQQVEFFRGRKSLSEIADAKMDGAKEGFVYLYAITAIGDVNGDGNADIAVADGSNPSKNNVYLGRAVQRGGGVFTPSVGTILSGATASAGDVNGDGYVDVLVGGQTLNKAIIYFGGPGEAFDVSEDWTIRGTGDFGASVR